MADGVDSGEWFSIKKIKMWSNCRNHNNNTINPVVDQLASTWSNLVPVLTNRRLIAVIRYQPGMDYDCHRFFAHCTNQRDSRYLINYKLAKATISWRPTKSTTRFKTITTIVVVNRMDQPSDLVPANAARLICPSTNGGINLFPSWLISLLLLRGWCRLIHVLHCR